MRGSLFQVKVILFDAFTASKKKMNTKLERDALLSKSVREIRVEYSLLKGI